MKKLFKGKNWKTTLAGLVTGGGVIWDAISNAIAAGSLAGKSGKELLVGIGIVVIGALSKDHNVTGGKIKQ